MFREWPFLLGEIGLLLLLAGLLGLLVGWLIWGRRSSVNVSMQEDLDACQINLKKVRGELDTARVELDSCRSGYQEKDDRIAALSAQIGDLKTKDNTTLSMVKADLQTCRTNLDRTRADLNACRTAQQEKENQIAALQAQIGRFERQASAKPAKAPAVSRLASTGASGSSVSVGKKPVSLKKPRRGKADDLKMIKGIGPQLEKLCHKLGYYHFNQIAKWTSQEVAWVDENLEGFKGRVTRDQWVRQAKHLAGGGQTEFSRRVEDGDVY